MTLLNLLLSRETYVNRNYCPAATKLAEVFQACK